MNNQERISALLNDPVHPFIFPANRETDIRWLNRNLHINNKDIVARVPPRILGFRHLGGGPRQFGGDLATRAADEPVDRAGGRVAGP